jgi:LPS-assembly protein
VNNFVTTFEFLEENNEIGSESYLSNESSYAFNGSNKLLYRERKNRKTKLQEFYNLIYQYENDCLVASIQYSKDYYSDRELKPTEELFFSITIVPFANVGSPKIIK